MGRLAQSLDSGIFFTDALLSPKILSSLHQPFSHTLAHAEQKTPPDPQVTENGAAFRLPCISRNDDDQELTTGKTEAVAVLTHPHPYRTSSTKKWYAAGHRSTKSSDQSRPLYVQLESGCRSAGTRQATIFTSLAWLGEKVVRASTIII